VFDFRLLWEGLRKLFLQVLPPSWRSDLLRALGSLLGQLPTLVFFYPFVFEDSLQPTVCALLLLPALIAYFARFLPGAAGVLFAGGLGALGTLPHAVLGGWGFGVAALMATGALAGLLVLAAVRWQARLLCVGLLAAVGLLTVGVVFEQGDCLAFTSVLIAAVGAGSGARLMDRWSALNVAKPPVDLAGTTRSTRALRRAIPAVLAVLPLAGVAAALPDSTGVRVACGGACALFALGPALVAWASDEEATLKSALLATLIGAVGLAAFAILQGRVWGSLSEVGFGQGDALADSLDLIQRYWAPFLLFVLTFAASAASLTAARIRRKEPLLALTPTLVVGAGVLVVAIYQRARYGWITIPRWEAYALVAPVVSFSWLLGLWGLDAGDRWLGRLAMAARRARGESGVSFA
jgi:hypothetical protein